jgi:hypothetical protein
VNQQVLGHIQYPTRVSIVVAALVPWTARNAAHWHTIRISQAETARNGGPGKERQRMGVMDQPETEDQENLQALRAITEKRQICFDVFRARRLPKRRIENRRL